MIFKMTAGGSRTFALSMTIGGNANIIEFDDSTGTGTRNSGVLLKQTISAFLLPRSTAVTHSGSWESTRARIVLAWRESLHGPDGVNIQRFAGFR